MNIYKIIIDSEGEHVSYYTSKRKADSAWSFWLRDGAEPESFETHDAIKLLEARDQEIKELREIISLMKARLYIVSEHGEQAARADFPDFGEWALDPYESYRKWKEQLSARYK